MRHETEIVAVFEAPCWLAPGPARRRLAEVVEAFVSVAACGGGGPDREPPALALKVTAGLGKTSTVLRAIARHAAALLSRGHVLVYMPMLDLAERAMAEFGRVAPAVPCRVVRGRQAVRPGTSGKTMCERADLARAIARHVPSVTQALCHAKNADGRTVASPCAAGCPYLAQNAIEGPHVVFLSHAYLLVRPPIDHDVGIALRVVDEKVWPTLVR